MIHLPHVLKRLFGNAHVTLREPLVAQTGNKRRVSNKEDSRVLNQAGVCFHPPHVTGICVHPTVTREKACLIIRASPTANQQRYQGNSSRGCMRLREDEANLLLYFVWKGFRG